MVQADAAHGEVLLTGGFFRTGQILQKKVQVDGVCQCLVAGFGRVQAVVLEAGNPELDRVLGVSHYLIEIQDRVIIAPGTYPSIYRFPARLAVLVIVGVALERHDGGAVDLQAVGVGFGNELFIGGNKAVGGRRCTGSG